MRFRHVSTPIGQLLVARDGEAITTIHFEKNGRPAEPPDDWTRDDSAFDDVAEQLRAYFAGELRRFELTLAPKGTPFQQDVWRALQNIPYASTTTYGAIARTIARPDAVRAVGAANGANPIPIVIPCHRVVGANGSLTGFGGGLGVKQMLLDLELYGRMR